MVWGRLYHLCAGFPALEVPEELILARGTADILADARKQQEIGTPHFGRPTGDWDLIYGELVTFTEPQRDLPPIDRLEGFRPDGHSMYQRVMVAAGCVGGNLKLPCRSGISARISVSRLTFAAPWMIYQVINRMS